MTPRTRHTATCSRFTPFEREALAALHGYITLLARMSFVPLLAWRIRGLGERTLAPASDDLLIWDSCRFARLGW